MTTHKTGTPEEWLAARLELLKAEKELTRQSDELVRQRLPWVRIDKKYQFETDEGKASLANLFRGRSQLLVYHFMFGADYTAGCPTYSTIADGFNGFAIHLANHDVMLWAVSRAPLAKLQAYKRRMGWTFPWASSFGGDFNADFGVQRPRRTHTHRPLDAVASGSRGLPDRPRQGHSNVGGSRRSTTLLSWVPFLSWAGDKLLLDCLSMPLAISSLVNRLRLHSDRRQRKGKTFERQVSEHLLHSVEKLSAVPAMERRFFSERQEVGEADVVVLKEDTAFLVECKSRRYRNIDHCLTFAEATSHCSSGDMAA